MMRSLALMLGVSVLSAGCGAESAGHGIGGTAGIGARAGAPGGGSSGTGGSAGDGSSGGGQGGITGPICPDAEPEAGSACDSTVINCRYDVCGDDTTKMLSCQAGHWRVTRACGALECPPERPLFLSDCAPLEGLQCSYVEDCCGSAPATQSVVARCEYSQWTLDGPPLEQACSFCRLYHEDGAACDQPSECVNVGCYRLSCYGQPLVEECIDSAWRVQTRCIK